MTEQQIVSTYRNMLFHRCDDNGTAYYFSAADFPGLHQEAFDFPSSLGHTLRGKLYCYDNPLPGRLIVFDHGMGGGHLSYMKEIERLCRAGSLVLGYDHTGCMESGGESTNGMAQSLHDLDDCLTAVKKDARLGALTLSVMGHSWGGFAAMNIAALHPEVRHAVVLSGVVAVPMLIESNFAALPPELRRAVLAVEEQANPGYVGCHGVESLKKADVRALLIYSDDDPVCLKSVHYDALEQGLRDCDRVELWLVEGKGHNPNYTADAVQLLGRYTAELARLTGEGQLVTDGQKAAFVASWDWERMTTQDEAVWEKILRFLMK